MLMKSAAVLLTFVSVALGQAVPPERNWAERIETLAEFDRLSKPSSTPPAIRFTKFLVPVRDGDPNLLPVVYQNVNVYPKHEEFLRAEFADKFPGLSVEEYTTLVEIRATREYWAGILFQFAADSYGFNIFTLGEDASELPRPEEARWVFEHLAATLPIGNLAYTPQTQAAIESARAWVAPGFPVEFPFGASTAEFVPYTRAVNYGRVRRLDREAFDRANDEGSFGSQDILVLEVSPRDIEGVIAGVITGTEQTELDHLAIRTARRGTPNAFVKNPFAAFAEYEGKLVRLEVTATGYTVAVEPSLAVAEAWWNEHRPRIDAIAVADTGYESIDEVQNIPIDGSVNLVTRYGGKGSNFARLHQLLPEANRVPGFVVPFYHYAHFMETNQTRSHKDPNRLISFAAYVEELLSDPEFNGDSRVRFAELERLREIIEDDGVVDRATVRSLAAKVATLFGSTTRTVRYRSSSNAEDLLEFNGAGLYRSTSVCAADDLDANDQGPSRCDATEDDERGAARGLKVVWASLWNFRAYEEREYYRIPHREVFMAVLVSEGFPDEISNGVAFTGNPDVVTDRRYLINAQVGDISVVLPEPGILPEKVLLGMNEGAVESILRVRRSSLVEAGVNVLDDAQLRELGSVMAAIDEIYPVEVGSHTRAEILLDFEFKFDRAGALKLKQVRPFLISTDTTTPPPAEFRIVVPEGFVACGAFTERREPRDVLSKKVEVGLKAGEHVLSADGTSPAELFEWIRIEEGGPMIPARGPGVWQATLLDRPVFGGKGYGFQSIQVFEVEGRPPIQVSVDNIFLLLDGSRKLDLDPRAFTYAINPYLFFSSVEFDPTPFGKSPLLPCDLDHLPHYTIDVAFDTGDRVHFEERFQILEEGTGPAELKLAEVELAGTARRVDSYWRLVYTAGHHNDQPPPEHWAVFDEPIDYEGFEVWALSVSQGFEEEGPRAVLLDANYEEILELGIESFTRLRDGINELEFVRGDVDFSGSVSITDAVKILRHAFLGRPIPCPDAADIDDLGTIDVSDAVQLLLYLFFGDEPPALPNPEEGCGFDEQPDALGLCFGLGCQ
jgi:hypothetical protein